MPKTKLQKYFEERALFYDALSPGQLRANEEIAQDRLKIIDTVDAAKKELTKEANEYERTHTSFFAVAISLIVAGMLSKLPPLSAHHAVKFFYLTAIIFALLAALSLFLEFRTTKKAFSRWIKHVQEIADYANSSRWTPIAFNNWIKQHNKKAEPHTSNMFFTAEVVFLSFSFISLTCWIIELLFNPNWPIFN